MTDIDWPLISEIFADALEQPRDQRDAFVAARCAGHPDLRAAVDRLLAARDDADPAFLRTISGEVVAEAAALAAAPLDQVGPWRVVREIGRGGMGQVYLAERADGQFEQQVAIKLVKRGMDSDAILARFLRERQILAALDHPNIARLLDGGVAADGRPYFVMEYVDGESITAFADARRLSVDERLTLFRAVCVAVEYAHRNLVVHRDLKPSNILVTNDGRPKLLDFGIAKLLSSQDDKAEAATLTSAGVRLLTPDYAAPEQFLGGPITTATDVYGLGAVLFHLLGGRPPFDVETRHGAERSPATEPVPLSAAPFRSAADLEGGPTPESVAQMRSTDPARLRRRLSGDLETIVATALRAPPERRYPSVGALHDDLQRHHQRLPVRARPDTLGYRASRFVRRHRVAVVAAGVVAALLVAFGASTAVQARALAVERDRAQREAAAAREVSEFLVGVFEVADPMAAPPDTAVSAADLLDRGATRIENDLAGQPAVQARLLGVIGRAYENLRRFDQAEPLLARAADLHRTTDGPESAEYVAALQRIGRARARRGDFARAEASLREAMAIQRRIAPGDAAMWGLFVDLATVFHTAGDNQKGNAMIAEAMRLFDRLPPGSIGHSRTDLRRMAELLGSSREWDRVDSLYSRLLDVERAAAGPRSPAVGAVYIDWAGAKRRRGDAVAADSMLAAAYSIQAAIDPTSLPTAHVVWDQANTALQRGNLVRADSLMRAVLEIYRVRLGDDHRQVAIVRTTHADVLLRMGRVDEAIEFQRLAQATFARHPSDAAVYVPLNQWRLGVALRELGRLEESGVEFEKALRTYEARFPANYLLTANLRRDYGELLVDVGRPADAERALRLAIDVLSARWGKDDYRVDAARISLGRALVGLGRRREARELLTAALSRLTASRGPDHALTRRARDALAAVDR